MGKHSLRQCPVADQLDSALITSGACHEARAKNMPHVSFLETSYAFKGNDLPAVLFKFLTHASGKALMPYQYAEGKSAPYSRLPCFQRVRPSIPPCLLASMHFAVWGCYVEMIFQPQHLCPWHQETPVPKANPSPYSKPQCLQQTPVPTANPSPHSKPQSLVITARLSAAYFNGVTVLTTQCHRCIKIWPWNRSRLHGRNTHPW